MDTLAGIPAGLHACDSPCGAPQTGEGVQAFSATAAMSSIERWGGGGDAAVHELISGEGVPVLVSPPAHHSRMLSAPVATENLSLVARAAIKSSLLQNVPDSLAEASPVTAEVAARELFAHIDRNGDGAISIEELQDVLRDLGEDSTAAAVEAQALHAALTDRPGADGQITFADLLSFHQSALSSDSGREDDGGAGSCGGARGRNSGSSAPACAVAVRQRRGHAGSAPRQPFGGHCRHLRLRRRQAPGVCMRASTGDRSVQQAPGANGAPGAGHGPAGVRTIEAPGGEAEVPDRDVLARPLLRTDVRDPDDDSSYRWTDPNAVQWDVPLDQLEQERAELEAVEDIPDEQRGFLDRINLDTIPGGLDTGNWQASDVVQMAGRSARMLRSVSPFKLALDEGAVDCLDNVLGALLLRDGQTALAVPAHGPLVMGATKFRGCDVVLDEPRVSGRHVFFEAVAGRGGMRLTVTDMGSTNGVYFNGEKLAPWSPAAIDVGDVIVLGAREFARFQVESVSKADLKVRAAARGLSSPLGQGCLLGGWTLANLAA